MSRAEIKGLAKEKIKGNIWEILWPLLAISIVAVIINRIVGPQYSFDFKTMKVVLVKGGILSNILSSIVTIAEAIFTAGYMKYLLDFVRKGSFDAKVIIETVKKKWLNILIASVVMGVIIFVGLILFVIPGIILAFTFAMVLYLIIDEDIEPMEALKKSKDMMKGHKFEYFVFGLSFIGWFLLVPFTLGLLLIWLVPYINVATMLYYDNLKKLN